MTPMARCALLLSNAFLLNETDWVFCLFFQAAMPALPGRDFLGSVLVIVTDSDSQETSRLNIAIVLNFTIFSYAM
jgi:hypothetical protein